MKNTAIPLSVAFIDGKGTIVNIEEMEPFTTESHCSAGWIRYALEMNATMVRQERGEIREPDRRVAGIVRFCSRPEGFPFCLSFFPASQSGRFRSAGVCRFSLAVFCSRTAFPFRSFVDWRQDPTDV